MSITHPTPAGPGTLAGLREPAGTAGGSAGAGGYTSATASDPATGRVFGAHGTRLPVVDVGKLVAWLLDIASIRNTARLAGEPDPYLTGGIGDYVSGPGQHGTPNHPGNRASSHRPGVRHGAARRTGRHHTPVPAA